VAGWRGVRGEESVKGRGDGLVAFMRGGRACEGEKWDTYIASPHACLPHTKDDRRTEDPDEAVD
jgi:hypothetical protein